jgi:hypothetical protein
VNYKNLIYKFFGRTMFTPLPIINHTRHMAAKKKAAKKVAKKVAKKAVKKVAKKVAKKKVVAKKKK